MPELFVRPHLASYLDDLRRSGKDIAVVRYAGNRRRVSRYADIVALAGRFASLLAERGIQPGDRVLLWGENSAEWIAAFYGCVLRGVVAVPLDAYGSPEFAARVAADVRPSLAVGDAALLQTLQGDWPRLAFEEMPDVLPAHESGPIDGLSRETPLQILFTSGTTGDPKGIVHTHGNVLASTEPIEAGARPYMRYERFVHPLRFLHTLPLSHVFGQTMGIWVPAIFTAEVHFESRPAAPWLVRTIRRERISVLASVPRVLSVLQRYLETEFPDLEGRIARAQGLKAFARLWRFRDLHSALGWRFWAFISGGGALPGPIEQFWNSLGFLIVQGYGMTETAALITLNHPFHVARGTIGKPLPGREVKIGPDGEVLVRGPMISSATWSGGKLLAREGEWLATGDLAEKQPTGELKFLGRKSEVIVTGAGVNLHPEDLEAALEQETEVLACAVVGIETPNGPEPCAVLALRGSSETAEARAASVLERANAHLADFQHMRRWLLWPEPDLPRTSTGKVRRAQVAAWVAGRGAADQASDLASSQAETRPTQNADWLLALIERTTGEAPAANSAESVESLRLEGDFGLDSLARMQLLAVLEDTLSIALDAEAYAGVKTLGELRQLVNSSGLATAEEASPFAASAAPSKQIADGAPDAGLDVSPIRARELETPDVAVSETKVQQTQHKPTASPRFIYPRWPWLIPIRWLRAFFVECIMRPLVWFLAAPRIVAPEPIEIQEPMLIIANHITSYDVPLLLQALPGRLRRHIAVAMSGEMLEDFRHARNMRWRWLNPLGPAAWLLVTAFANVFPLPRQRDFQRSFAHAGDALDHGFNVIVFPEGARSPEGAMAPFRPGIGLLVKQSYAPVLPMALEGLGELKTSGQSWFRSGKVVVRVGQPIRFAAGDSESAITARLQAEVERLMRSGAS